MGGALYALGASTVALDQNPANLAIARVYHIEALGGFGPEARRQIYGAALADSSSNRYGLAGGASFSYSAMDPDGIDRSWTDLRFAVALPFADRFSVGVLGRYVRGKQGVAAGPLGKSAASDGTPGDPAVNHVTFGVGASAKIVEGLRIGVAGQNLTNSEIGWLPMLLGSGIGYSSGIVSIEGGSEVDFTTWAKPKVTGMGGLELFFADRFALRGGYRYNDGLRTHAVSGGAGYVDPRWGVDLGFRREVNGPHPATMLSLSIRIFVPTGAAGGSGEGFF